jgi:hypothetical protein
MATLQIGGTAPLQVSDEQLNAYRTRVQGGEDANQVALSFFQNAGQEIEGSKLTNPSGSFDTGVLQKYGFVPGSGPESNFAMQFLANTRELSGTGVQALSAVLRGEAQPTQYNPTTKQVVAGTAPAPVSGGSNQEAQFTPAYKAIVLADGREINYDYADPEARALADSGQLRTKEYAQTGTAPDGYQAPSNPAAPGAQQQGQVTTGAQLAVVPPSSSLQPGQSGPEVKKLQDWLVSQGYMTPQQVATGPGIYGPQTTAAMAKWQQDHGVDNSSGVGFYGPRTMAAISSQVAPTGGQQGTTQGTQVSTTDAFNSSPVGSYLASIGINADDSWSDSFQTQPVTSVQSLFDQIYQSSGLDQLKGQINSYNAKIQEFDDELFDKIQEVNDNPWYSEGVRQKKVAQLQEKYDNKKLNYETALTRAQGMYDSGREDARWAVSQTLTQYNADRNFQQGQLEFAVLRAENAQEAAVKAKQQEFENELDIANLELDSYKAQTGGGGLSASQINSTVNSIAGAFDNEPIVKEFNTIQGYVSLFNSLGTSASDDQARIYAFAKVMDPNSVVRESEYKTVQEYSQALLRAAGINVARVFTATGALSPDARSAMSNTLGTKLNVQSGLYNQLSGEYQRQVDDAYSGKPRTITNYQPSSVSNYSLAPAQGLVEENDDGGFWSSVGGWLFGSN